MARVPLLLMGGAEDERLNPQSAVPNVAGYEQSEYASSQTLINMYYRPSLGGRGGALVGTPGAAVIDTAIGADTVRCMISDPLQSRLYVVAGNDLSYYATGTETDIGDLNTSLGRVRAAANMRTQEIILVDGTNGYIIDTSGVTVAVIADVDYIDAADVCAQMDGYFLVADTNATDARFYWSALNDGTAWDALDFATKESGGDQIRDIIVKGRELYLIGPRTTEVWYNSGDPDQVFKRAQGGVIEYGTLGSHMAAVCAGKVMFPALKKNGSGGVVAIDGTSVEFISDHAIGNMVEKIDWRETYPFGYSFMERGHEFYAMSAVRSASTSHPTIVYDATTGHWHLRSHYHATTFPSGEIWTAAEWDNLGTVSFQPGTMAYGHRASGAIYLTNRPTTSGSNITNAGTGNNTNVVPRRVIGPMIRSDRLIRFREVVLELGNHAGTGAVAAGDISIYVSKDGGNTWGSAITPRLNTTYAPGGGIYRVNNLGAGRNWRFRLDINTNTDQWFIKGMWGTPAGDESPRVTYG